MACYSLWQTKTLYALLSKFTPINGNASTKFCTLPRINAKNSALFRECRKATKVRLSSFNPVTHISSWMDGLTQQKSSSQSVTPTVNQQTTVSPETEDVKDAEIVSGQFVPDQAITMSVNNAEVYTERLRKTIANFNEDKMTPMKWFVVKFFEVLSYLAPILVAFVVGMAIGDAWSGPFDIHNPWTIYSYVISIVLELMLPALGYALTVTLKQALIDRTKIGLLVVLGLLFLGLATGNSFATMFLVEQHLNISANHFAMVSMYFRSFTPMTVDIIATIFLSVVTVKNFQKFLKDKTAEAAAIRAGAEAEIAVDDAFQAAARRKRDAEAEQRRKDEQMDTMQEFYRIQNQKLLQDARAKLLDSPDSDTTGRGRYGGW